MKTIELTEREIEILMMALKSEIEVLMNCPPDPGEGIRNEIQTIQNLYERLRFRKRSVI